MKKIAICLAVCAILFTANSLAQEKYMPYLLKESLKKSTVQYKSGVAGSYPRHAEEFNWDTDWVPFRTIETSYTSFGEPSAIEYKQGVDRTRSLFSYNNQNQQTEAINQVMTDGAWLNQSREVSSYNNLGYMEELRDEQWNGTGWDLKFGTQVSYEMNGNQLLVMTAKAWNTETSAWDNSMRETYTYSGEGTDYASSIMDMWDNAWVPTMKYEYIWAGHQVSESLSYTYENDEWILTGKTTYEFLENDSSIMTSYAYAGDGIWSPSMRMTSTFDTHGNATLVQTEMFMADWTVFTATRFQLTYTGNNLTQRITQAFSMFPPAAQGTASGATWRNMLKEVFSNFASMSTDANLLDPAGMSVFPNPAGKQVTVRLSMQKAGSATLSLISATGQKILEETVTFNGSDLNYLLNLNEVPPGTYLLTARDKQGVEIGKIRLVRIRE